MNARIWAQVSDYPNVDLFNGWLEHTFLTFDTSVWHFCWLVSVLTIFFWNPALTCPSPPCKAEVCSVIRCGRCLVLDKCVCTSCVFIKPQEINPGNRGQVKGAQTLWGWLLTGTNSVSQSLPHLPTIRLRECAQLSFVHYLVIFWARSQEILSEFKKTCWASNRFELCDVSEIESMR